MRQASGPSRTDATVSTHWTILQRSVKSSRSIGRPPWKHDLNLTLNTHASQCNPVNRRKRSNRPTTACPTQPCSSASSLGSLKGAEEDARCFVDLVKGMLQLEADRRISPRAVLDHPFSAAPAAAAVVVVGRQDNAGHVPAGQ